jgi:hypothetical protein
VVPNDAAIIERLCVYLNSNVVAEWLAEHCQRAANGFLRLQSSVLKAIPIPEEFGLAGRKRRPARRRDSHPELPGLAFRRLCDDHAF